MRKHYVLLVILLFLQQFSFGQDYEAIQGIKVGITPSALMNRWLGFQGKTSYTYQQFGIEANVGYLAGTNNNEPYSGYRIRPQVKYYFKSTEDDFYYIGVGGLYRKVNIDANGSFGRFDFSFFQNLDFKITHVLRGYFFTTGQVMSIYKDRFFMDFGVGFGRGSLQVEHFDVPSDAELINSSSFLTYDSRSKGKVDPHSIFFIHFALMYRF